MRRSLLRRSGPMLHAARTAAVGNMPFVGNRVGFDDGPVHVSGMDYARVHVEHGGVVSKVAAAPLAAGKPDAQVAAAVIHAAVVPHLGPPVALVIGIVAVVPAPVAGRPQCAGIRRRSPGPGNPEIVAIAVSPVAGRPHQVRLRANGLLIDWQRRWGKAHADGELGVQRRRNDRHQQRKQEQTGRAKESHGKNLQVPSSPRRSD